MLAREAPTLFHAEFQNFSAEILTFFQITLFVGIIEDQRMQIAVACVKDIGNFLGHTALTFHEFHPTPNRAR